MSDRDIPQNETLIRAAARDSLFAEFGEALHRHFTVSEIDELVDERALRILRAQVSERVAA